MAQIVVGISDLKVCLPPDTIITYALGSCVGICLYDTANHVSGLSHIMLPSMSATSVDQNKMKFADTAIPELIRQMSLKGASKMRLSAKIAGGAQMFSTAASSAFGDIGKRNVEAVKSILASLRIPIVAQDILLNYGRTVEFRPDTLTMCVKSISKGNKEL